MKECNLKEMCRLTVIGFLALIVMGVLMSLYSCGSHKFAMKQEISTQKVDSIRQIRDFGFTSMQDISSFLRSTTNRKINWQLYDTTKPINPATGKHPLLAEGNTEENNEIGQNTDIVVSDNTVLKANSLLFYQERKNDKREEVLKKDKTVVLKRIGDVIWALTVLGGVIIAGWLIYKFMEKKKVHND